MMVKRWIFFLTVSFIATNVSALNEDSLQKMIVIRSIIFEGNEVTKDFVIQREMRMHVGDAIDASKLNETLEFDRIRILNCKLFSDVSYNLKNWKNDSLDVHYKVKELFYWVANPIFSLADRNFNVWWNEKGKAFNRLNIGGAIARHNFRGRNEEIGAEVQAGFNKRITLYYLNPYLGKSLRHGIKTEFEFETGREIHARTERNKQVFYRNETENPYRYIKLDVRHLYRPGYASTHATGLAFYHFDISDSLFGFQPDFLGGRKSMNYFELNYEYNYQLTDNRMYPEIGWEVQLKATKKGLGIFNQISQSSIYLHLSNYNKISRHISVASHARGRLSFPAKQPFFNNRAMGFRNDFIRGYEYYLMDGSHYGLLRSNLRYKVSDYTLTQSFAPIFQHLPIQAYVKAFGDAGYAYNVHPSNSFLNNRVLTSYGVGLDVVVSYYILMRIEFSFNQLGQNGLFLHSRKE